MANNLKCLKLNNEATRGRMCQIRNGLLAWTVMLSVHAQAQTSKGKILLGGSFGISSSANREEPVSRQTLKQNGRSFSVNPGIGFFVADGWALGIDLGYQSSFSESTVGSSITTTRQTNRVFFVSPFARYYRTLGERISFFGEVSVGSLSSGTTRVTPATPTQGSTTFKRYQIGLGITPGVTYFISPKVGIEASLGLLSYYYNQLETELEKQAFGQPQTSTRSSNAFNFFGLSNFQIGAKVYLGK